MPPSKTVSPPPSVLFVTPECAPLVKTGGLGDVAAALPKALRDRDIDVRVLLPGYSAVIDANPDAVEIARFEVLGQTVRLLESKLPSGVPLIVVANARLYERGGGPYQADDGDDWEDNALRFGVLSKVAAVLGSSLSPLAWRPSIVHCHDWPAALASLYLRFMPGPRAASMLTIHNLAFQGVHEFHDVGELQLPAETLGMDGVEFYGKVSMLKAGIVYSDAVTTVSPTYAREIQTPELGLGLHGVFAHRANGIFGVLNGIDTDLWNPATDPNLALNYGALTLERKIANKRLLKKRFGLTGGDEVPLFATVSRISEQKGIDVIANAIPQLLDFPAEVIIVGTGDRGREDHLRSVQAMHPEGFGVHLGFDEPLSHLVEAGADAFLMPSRFEPCGMNQMYSQRYGTPPIANSTGGLLDTIADGESGILIPEPTVSALIEGVGRAIEVYCQPAQWKRLQLNGMTRDFGWGPSAKEYERLYRLIS